MGSVIVGSAVGGVLGSGMATLMDGAALGPDVGVVFGAFSGGYVGFIWGETAKRIEQENSTNATHRLHEEE